jgi:hypothetical protein
MTAGSRQMLSGIRNAEKRGMFPSAQHTDTGSRTKQSLPSICATSTTKERVRRTRLVLTQRPVEPNVLPENSCECVAQRQASVDGDQTAAGRKDQSTPALGGPLLPHEEHSAGAVRHTVTTQRHIATTCRQSQRPLQTKSYAIGNEWNGQKRFARLFSLIGSMQQERRTRKRVQKE